MATTTSSRSSAPSLPPELLVLGVVGLGSFVAWQAGHIPLSRWALRHHLFTSHPVVEFPSAAVAQTGPTSAALFAALTFALALILATVTATGVWTWRQSRYDATVSDRERTLPTRTAAATLATTTGSAVITALTVLSGGVLNQFLVLAAAVFAAFAATATAIHLLRPRIERVVLISEITAATHSYLGFTRFPDGRIVVAGDWDDTNTPHTLTLTYAGRIERLPKELGEHIDSILQHKYTLSTDRKKHRITATLATETNTDPSSISRLRSLITTTTMFEASATLTDIQPPDTAEFTSFTVQHSISHKLAGSVRAQLLERKISDILPGRWRGNWDMERDHVTFSLRPEFPAVLAPLLPKSPPMSADEAIRRYPQTLFPFADDEDGATNVWDPKRFPHALIIGTTGSGKTSTTHTLIMLAALFQWPVFIFDFKGIEFTAYREWPNVQMVITEVVEAMTVMARLHRIMMERYDKGKLDPTAKEHMLPFLIVIDEFTEFADRINEFFLRNKESSNKAKEAPTLGQFYSMARLARTTRLHMSVGLQRPDATIMSGEGRDNFIMRISMGKLSRVAAEMMWESSYVGRTVPPGVRGRGTSRNLDGTPVEVQCYYTPDINDPSPDAQRVITALRPKVSSHERLLVVPPDKSAATPETLGEFMSLEIVRAADRPDLDPVSPSYYRISQLADVDPSAAMTPTHDTTTVQHRKALISLPDIAAQIRPTMTHDPLSQWLDELEPPQSIPISDLEPGDYLLVDEGCDQWAILREPPSLDEGSGKAYLCVCDPDTGKEETVEYDIEDTVMVRPEKSENDASAA